MNSYGLKVTTPYNSSNTDMNVKKIYNAFGDMVLTDAGVYEVHCTSDTFVSHNIMNKLVHVTCVSGADDININIKASGLVESDEVADLYHKIIAQNQNVKCNIECRGVVKDNSKIIYRSSLEAKDYSEADGKSGSGGASGAGAQSGKFLLLSNTAEVDAEPSLDIASKNFPTTHAIGVSGINKIKMWYLLARGYSEEEAEREIVEGFLNKK